MLKSAHPLLIPLIAPVRKLYDQVRRKALLRLSYDGKAGAVAGDEQVKAEYAMEKVGLMYEEV